MKKTITTITLAMTFAFGATFANADAGIIIGDRATDSCTKTDGIIIGDMFTGIINEIAGIIIGDAPKTEPCSTQTDGIIIGD